MAVRSQRDSLTQTAHRPWPLPDGPWVVAQTWEDLLFAHWRVRLATLRRVVPSPIPIDTFDGSAWLGVTPLVMRGVRPRLTPPLPVVSRFAELNVRTYATIGGRPGIYFISLDAARWLAVWGARRTFRLPYFHARIRARHRDGALSYSSERLSSDGEPARFRARYRPRGEPFEAGSDSLEYFLTERYCLYALDEQHRVLRADIHHPPWGLQLAEAEIEIEIEIEIEENTMADPVGLRLEGKPLLHFARRQDVLTWPLSPAEAESR